MSDLNISNFIWNVADDVRRAIYFRGNYRDTILSMPVRALAQETEGVLEVVLTGGH